MGEILYLIDGHAQIYRAYHAIRGGLNSPVTGEPTAAVFGVANMLLKLYLNYRPAYVAMAIDVGGKTFRDEIYGEYKATREARPADLESQEQRVYELCRLFGIPILSFRGCEADDVIATIAHQVTHDAAWAGVEMRIVSRDKDLEQLLGPRVAMFDIHTDTTIDVAALKATKGIEPSQVVDVLALMGDAIDNVPGVEGVGPKTAAQWIQQYGSIDGLIEHIGEVRGKKRESLLAAREMLPISRQLVKLKDDVPVSLTPAQAKAGGIDFAGLESLFRELGFRRLEGDLRKLAERAGEKRSGQGPRAKGEEPSPYPLPGRERAGKQAGFAATLFEAAAEAEEVEEQEESGQVAEGQEEPSRCPPPGRERAKTEDARVTASASAAKLAETLTSAEGCDYRAITTEAELRELVETLRQQELIAVDTETIGLGPTARLCGLSFAWRPEAGVYVPCRCPDAPCLEEKVVLDTLRPVLEDPRVGKTGHNIKYDGLVLRNAGVRLRGIRFDSLVAAHLLDLPGRSLDDLAMGVLRHKTIPISDLIGPRPRKKTDTGQRTMDQVPLAEITPYAAEDADLALRMYQALTPKLKLLGMTVLAERVEMPLVEVLVEMEYHGIRLDVAELERQKQELSGRIDALRQQIGDAAGGDFNPDSPKQLAKLLFKKLKLPVIKRTKTGPSTDVEVLERLLETEGLTAEQLRVPRLIVEYRKLTKLVSTYLGALGESVSPRDGRIHASFHQTGTATGRLSSSGPNLQNVPVRTEVGRQIRRAFVAEEGNVLISADYSQIELRILAHLSRDAALTAAFEADQDIHAAVAAQVFGVPLEQVSQEQRGHAKVINFGIIYGVTPWGLARRIDGLDVEGAKKLIADYRRRFAGIDEFLGKCVEQATQLGYVTTMLGRRRSIPQIKSRNPATRALGERLAINSVVQGSAAELMKLAMVNLHRRIEREGLGMKVLLQIHDELVVEAPASDAQRLAEVVREEMQTAMQLRVPLKVEAAIGQDWLAAK